MVLLGPANTDRLDAGLGFGEASIFDPAKRYYSQQPTTTNGSWQ